MHALTQSCRLRKTHTHTQTQSCRQRETLTDTQIQTCRAHVTYTYTLIYSLTLQRKFLLIEKVHAVTHNFFSRLISLSQSKSQRDQYIFVYYNNIIILFISVYFNNIIISVI